MAIARTDSAAARLRSAVMSVAADSARSSGGRPAAGEGQGRRDDETESAAAKGVRIGERVGHRDVWLRVEEERS